jgi:hypothetical protein
MSLDLFALDGPTGKEAFTLPRRSSATQSGRRNDGR